ncbi:MAG: CvpA family protein [Lachnospiraceae bacterium]|nr:CvpA family protein [Lachnospiraceae bacterium]
MNILLLAVIAVTILKIMDGYKKGMVKEIISFVSLVVMCVVVLLLGSGLHSYMEKEILGVVIAVLLLVILGIAHHALKLVFFSAKLISKLPIVHSADKILGMLVGALEVVLILWTLYTFIMHFEMGMIGNLMIEYSRDSKILTWIYEHNMLAGVVEKAISNITL